MDTWSKCSTYIIECVVGSNKVVSAHEAHVEIPKVEAQDEGRKERRVFGMCLEARRPPIVPRGVGLFLYTPSTCLSFPTFAH